MEEVTDQDQDSEYGNEPQLDASQRAAADDPETHSQSGSGSGSVVNSHPNPNPNPNLKGRIKQMLWNQAAREAGLEGVDVMNRYAPDGKEEAVLMRGGRVWGGSY
ncbi:uncharacterized protein PV07_04947 [Cladophialophora immunda]|uniref:Uncharacterized protein n=1 Tax=Cladophialophora immunda TaxID=569365 RepID=A0A0D2CFW2_9EURO|nr:uncharacterized protein PV07_04947 [Cladophialophora immunda]KIW29110.1 hypothetical protein PV07_04947 [Cladophialophora immunda]